MAREVGGFERLQSLVKTGLAAVRVRVGLAHLPGLEAQIAELSGFRLSQDMIITCAHFTDWDIAGNNVEFFLNGQNGVCEAIQARMVKGGDLKGRFALRLWAIHKAWDIAVFRITDWPINNSQLSVIKKEDIYLATPEDCHQLKDAPQGRFWSVGYNRAVNLDELRQRFTAFYSKRQRDEQLKISHRYEFSDTNPPGAKFLEPNKRTISFGTNIGFPHDAKEHQACVELSAWYGRSGSMVCAEKDGSSVVIGIVQGGEEGSDCNLILLFNTEMRQWLAAATELGNGAGQQDITKRVVMA
ncbi:hypothetical protein CLAIMM_00614 [Cladophialophora immunda]|nr:hypothetical protein CLAIMM_00614 [Cladophialophora immunda]